MFWALILEPYKRYSQNVKASFHVSMACMDTSLATETSVQIMVNYKERNFLLCTLNKDAMWQTPLDLTFVKGSHISFLCTGRSPVHLTGYLLPNLDNDSKEKTEEGKEQGEKEQGEEEQAEEQGEEEQEEEEQEEEEQGEEEQEEEEQGEDVDLIVRKRLKRKAESPKSRKKVKLIKQESFNESNIEDDDDFEENWNDLEEDSDEDMEDEEGENENENDDEEEEEQELKFKKLAKSQKHKKKEIENQQQKKKHDKQKKINEKEIKQEPQSKKQKKKTEQQNNLNRTKKRIIEGGVQVEDLKSGYGAFAMNGKVVTIYYVGRCKIGKEEKKIDSCMQGNGFKFRLGKGRVIKGWDVGISGMKVGGKRRLTIPPNMGYGPKGSPPTIPGNSTLVYEIELKNVH